MVGGVQGPQDASFPFMNYSLQEMVEDHQGRPRRGQCKRLYGGGQGATNGGLIYYRPEAAERTQDRARRKSSAGCAPRSTGFRSPPPSSSRCKTCGSEAAPATRCISTRFRPTIHRPRALGPDPAGEHEEDAKTAGRKQRSAEWWACRRCSLRSVTAARLGQTAQSLEQCALRRLRSVAGLRYLHPDESVLRRAGSGSAILAISGWFERHLYQPGSGIDERQGGREHHDAAGNCDHAPDRHDAAAGQSHGTFPSVTISFNLAPGVSMSQATRSIQQMEQRLGVPSTIHGFFAGTLAGLSSSRCRANPCLS